MDNWERGRPTQFPLGEIPEEWNWLDGHSPVHLKPKNVHFTTGGPWFDLWKPERDIDKTYSNEWEDLKNKIVIEEGLKDV